MITIKSNEEDIKYSYAKHLNECIDNYWSKSNQKLIKQQSDYFNQFYSWEVRAKEWNNLFKELSND